MSPILEQQDVIIRDSIIENKERTKNYWEQLMMAAASEPNGKIRVWDSPDSSISQSNICKNYKNLLNVSLNSMNNHKDFVDNHVSMEILKHEERADSSLNLLSMEDRIALELQEQKEREEELKRLRRQLSLENGKEQQGASKEIGHVTEELYSIQTNDDSTFSEYGSEEKEHSLDGNSRVNTPYLEDFIHRRTQSLDSVSSGHSSGSNYTLNDKDRDSPRKKISVRPYEDPSEEEEIPSYKRNENETPIEREIRIAKEREEELRKEKGIALSNVKLDQIKIQKNSMKKDAVENDTRDVQHRIATNRIQQEIEEANERENQLRTEGKILTTSEERVDAKVTRFTQLAEFAISEKRHKGSKMMKSHSVSQIQIPDSEKKFNSNSRSSNGLSTRLNRRYTPNSTQKGIMQRFIATKGQIPFSAVTNPDSQTEIRDMSIRRPLGRSLSGIEATSLVRKGYIPAGEKIQEELKEMEKREEELRLQRALNPISSSFFHRSQPNLLNISDDEEYEERTDWTGHKVHKKPVSRLSHSLSNPNLLDDSLDKVNVRLPNKRFSLLQEWENRIQSAQ